MTSSEVKVGPAASSVRFFREYAAEYGRSAHCRLFRSRHSIAVELQLSRRWLKVERRLMELANQLLNAETEAEVA